jgi:DNA-binding GntR family transcriptional regulator
MYAWSPRPTARTLSLPEQIAEQIGNSIIQGQYEPGQRVQEQEAADAFQVSRGPVREALRILERDGLVQINARRGAQVTQLDVDELKDIFEVRATLLGLAARLVAERRDPVFLAALKAGVDRLRGLARLDDPDGFSSEVYQLSLMMADATGNKFLRSMVFGLAHRTLRYARLGLSTEKRRVQSAVNWRRILVAIQENNTGAAEQAAGQVVRDSRDMAVKLLAEPPPAKPARAARRPRARAPQ